MNFVFSAKHFSGIKSSRKGKVIHRREVMKIMSMGESVFLSKHGTWDAYVVSGSATAGGE